MPPSAANLTSLDALRTLRAALLEFRRDMENALIVLEIEGRRPLEWIDADRALYWPAAMRQASDDLNSARINLERCELAIRPDDRRSCYDEKQAFAQAKERLRLCEAKIPVVRAWRLKIHKEVEEFQVQISKLRWYLESQFPRAIRELEQMIAALERYVEQPLPESNPPAPSGE